MKHQKISIYECKPGSVIARDILDLRSGMVLYHKGHILTEASIELLKKFTCSEIFVEEDSWGKVWNVSKEKKACYEENKTRLRQTLIDIQQGSQVDTRIIQDIKDTFFKSLDSNNVIMGCVNIVKSLDEYTYTHSLNVGMLAVLTGRWLGLKDSQIDDLFIAGILHDTGKYRIDTNLIKKRGRLTDIEYAAVKKHVIEGYNLIKDNPSLSDDVKQGIFCHHERIDGSGYPRGLKDDEIHLFGRIIAIVDTYDAMISERSYKQRKTPFEVMETMLSEGINKLDTKILLTFLRNMANYYIGVFVTLNTGQVGEVVFMHPHCIYKPIIKVDDTYYDLDTRHDLKIVDMI